MPPLALTRDDFATIAFVVACLFSGAIDREELRAWADHVLASVDAPPLYLVDLSTFDEANFHIYRVIGFVPGPELSAAEQNALAGIVLARGRSLFEATPSPATARAALAAQPQVLARFRETFPFLSVSPA